MHGWEPQAGESVESETTWWGGVPKTEDLVYLWLLEKGNGGVELEYLKNTVWALLDFKRALPSPVNIMMYLGGAEERHPRYVSASGACVICMEGR